MGKTLRRTRWWYAYFRRAGMARTKALSSALGATAIMRNDPTHWFNALYLLNGGRDE